MTYFTDIAATARGLIADGFARQAQDDGEVRATFTRLSVPAYKD